MSESENTLGGVSFRVLKHSSNEDGSTRALCAVRIDRGSLVLDASVLCLHVPSNGVLRDAYCE